MRKSFTLASGRVLPALDLAELRPEDSQSRKNALKAAHPRAVFCIVRGCCAIAAHDSALCLAHRAGLPS